MKKSATNLIDGLRSGDHNCFNEIYSKYFRRLHFFANKYLDNSSEAENLVQDAFMKLWVRHEQVTCVDEVGLLSWLYTVLKNDCLQYLKKELTVSLDAHKERQTLLDMQVLEDMDTSEQTFEEMQAAISKAIEGLPAQCQLVFRKSKIEGLKNREIAAELSITEKAVERNMTRALKQIRVSLKDYLPILSLFMDI